MRFQRSSGILLHPSSLPGPYGIGDIGPQAHRFADFLAGAGQRIWQVLPLGPTGCGDSPYQCFSSFAGNPLLISIDVLVDRGYLVPSDVADYPDLPAHEVDYGRVIEAKKKVLRRAFAGFRGRAGTADFDGFERWCARNTRWVEDYSLFMALKDAHGGEALWTCWEPAVMSRSADALSRWRNELADEILYRKFEQYEFSRQWESLKSHCQARGIRIMGDIPIYVAHDSADVWSHPELFRLDECGRPRVVAGVPPDYFSATGQLWGNPIYHWQQHQSTGFAWWTDRLRAAFSHFDLVRFDHFRGLEAYWEVPAGAETAAEGRWVKGPGAALLEALQAELGCLPLVAEDLGVITPEVEAIRRRFDFPGMAILQFAFGKDPQGPDFRPHNYQRHLVAYTGTHDNDTTLGWWNSEGASDSTRTPDDIRVEKEFARQYLATDGRDIHWILIRALMASVADTVIIPMQDVLGLGSEARMNLPARPYGNWRWRYTSEMLTAAHQERLKALVRTYDR